MTNKISHLIGGALLALGVLAFGAFPALAQSQIVPAHLQNWQPYVSTQFSVSSDVPTTGFVFSQQNNDYGLASQSQDGSVSVTVFAAYWNDNAAQFSDYRALQRQKLEQIGANITYAPGGNSWFVFSGFLGEDIFYFKASTRPNCPLAGHIYFKFPAYEKDTMGPIIEHMEDSMRLNPSDVCPT